MPEIPDPSLFRSIADDLALWNHQLLRPRMNLKDRLVQEVQMEMALGTKQVRG